MISSKMMTSHQIVSVVPALAVSLKPLAHHRTVASVSFSYSYYFGRCLSERLNWFHFLILVAVPLVILIGCIFFCHLSQIDVVRMSMSTVSFLAQLDSRILSPQNVFL